jgi:photoactive yellow protein
MLSSRPKNRPLAVFSPVWSDESKFERNGIKALFGNTVAKIYCCSLSLLASQLYGTNMGFDQQIAQADQISTESLLTNPISLTNKRVHADKMTEEELDHLPFGAIQLDTDGNILKYNDYESRLAGVSKSDAIGRNFFTEIAPCTNVKEFYGRFKVGVEKKMLHEKFRYHFAFTRNPVDVTVTLFYSGITRSIWVFVRPV